jgi:hypothetical protein
MSAYVEKSSDAVCIFADDDDLFAANAKEEIITLVRNARDMTCQQPFAADNLSMSALNTASLQ